MKHLNANERELIKLMNFFTKKTAQLVESGILSEEHVQIKNACNNLTDQLLKHSEQRAQILEKR
ncbi:MAG: hypothetical protein LPK19_01715, partial [Hymenobacteraceae bacterium]|nr:hypothetical protein [Hymenobacteraceae bacterium]MDX5394891.1 hypothetical protein [Hymenobacteraceae bacterium]MDX5510927.1 hypothetical protein [Hymenobacteraceae bacterium]